jgi:CDP-2,3-bis-(O-geranylgeranyl)-sn-glycerol synthase
MAFLILILKSIYVMMPAYFANMAPVIVKKWFKRLAIPIDFNKKINKKPIFGKNKTFRGLIFAIIFAIIIAFIQKLLFNINAFQAISINDYSNWILFGFLMGFGAIFGDLVESFVKRRLNFESGKPFIPFDQIDFILGALLFASFIVDFDLIMIIIILLVSIILHILVNHFAYYTKIRNEKW